MPVRSGCLAQPRGPDGAEPAATYHGPVRYSREIEVDSGVDATFAYLTDFANAAEWDPGIVEARRLTPAPTAVGSRFEVIALFRGRRQRFEYVVTDFEEPQRIALRGEGEKAVSDDVITRGRERPRDACRLRGGPALEGRLPCRRAVPRLDVRARWVTQRSTAS